MHAAKLSFHQYLYGVMSAFKGPSPVDERRVELLAALRSDLELEFEADSKQRAQDITEQEDAGQRHVMSLVYEVNFSRTRLDREIDSAIAGISSYTTATVQMLHSAFHGTGHLKEFLLYAPKEEAAVRSAIAFKSIVSSDGNLTTVINDVRRSTGIDDFSEMNPGTAGHDLLTAVLTIAVGASKNRKMAYFRQHKNDGSSSVAVASNFGKWLKQENNTCKMTPELALVIVDYPERTTDILNYIDNRDGDIKNIDGGHLRAHLDTPAVALAEGVL